jgi:hypothetical protein
LGEGGVEDEEEGGCGFQRDTSGYDRISSIVNTRYMPLLHDWGAEENVTVIGLAAAMARAAVDLSVEAIPPAAVVLPVAVKAKIVEHAKGAQQYLDSRPVLPRAVLEIEMSNYIEDSVALTLGSPLYVLPLLQRYLDQRRQQEEELQLRWWERRVYELPVWMWLADMAAVLLVGLFVGAYAGAWMFRAHQVTPPATTPPAPAPTKPETSTSTN